MEKKRRRRFLVLLIIIGVCFIFFKRSMSLPREVQPLWEKTLEGDVEEMGILAGDSLVLWNGNILSFYDKKGQLMVEQDHSLERLKAYFGQEWVYLYDKDLKRIYTYSKKGQPGKTLTVPGDLFALKEQNGRALLHIRQENGEVLYMADSQGALLSLFETEHFILDYEVAADDDFVVAELSNQASGYRTTLFKNDGDFSREEFPMEVAMALGRHKNQVYMLTEKKLYALGEGQIQSVEVPLVSDVLMKEDGIYLLHSGILSKYNFKLDLAKKEVVPANVLKLQDLGQAVYSYGQADMVGNLLGPWEFSVRFPQTADRVLLSKDLLIRCQGRKIYAYGLKRRLPWFMEEGLQEIEETKEMT
ncbi:MAG: DUF5711 family protein [Tissierellia bacterium]|nr:DUF5711 family protein [Tissierellia bacterium]